MAESMGTVRTATMVGAVLRSARDKTVTVVVERRVKHPLYGKFIKRSTKLYVHDEDNLSEAGDMVKVELCRPMSKNKRWRLVSILNRAQ